MWLFPLPVCSLTLSEWHHWASSSGQKTLTPHLLSPCILSLSLLSTPAAMQPGSCLPECCWASSWCPPSCLSWCSLWSLWYRCDCVLWMLVRSNHAGNYKARTSGVSTTVQRHLLSQLNMLGVVWFQVQINPDSGCPVTNHHSPSCFLCVLSACPYPVNVAEAVSRHQVVPVQPQAWSHVPRCSSRD